MLIQDYLDICDPVLTFDRFMGGIELEKYLKNIPQHDTGRLRYDPVSMLKTVLFGFMANGYISLRELENQCKVNLRFMYLMDHQTPSYRTFGYFINEVLADPIEEIFQDINKKIFETEHVDTQHIYIDGSKFEANANKYSWVWKKSTEKSRYRLFDKITTLFEEINEELSCTGIKLCINSEYASEYLKEAAEQYAEAWQIKEDGAMATGWQQVGNTWYYLNGSGAMQTGWLKRGSKWYYLNGSGAMVTGWLKSKNIWYYLKESGAMTTGWQKISNKWYYLKSNGAMTTGWQKISGKWHYMNGSGAILTGWNQIGGKWYYMYSSGAMASNTWIGSYYVNGSGVWTKTRRSYPAGNYNVGSVYGPSLTQKELDQVADAVQKFIRSYNSSAMNDYQKIRTAMLYLESNCTYAADCYYVHANSKASNPSHQWNEVRVNGQWYITDPQLGISTLEMIGLPFLMSESTYSSMFGMAWDHTSLPNCPKDYK